MIFSGLRGGDLYRAGNVLLHRIEIDLDEESLRGDSMYSSVQSRHNIFSESFH